MLCFSVAAEHSPDGCVHRVYRIADKPDAVLRTLEHSGSDPEAQRDLFSKDQLHNAMTSSETHPIQNFSEAVTEDGRMPFPPTYKFRTGTCMYDSKRTPSWTDRVLWRCNYVVEGQAAVAATSYACVPSMLHSDHRPVVSAMHVQLKHSREVVQKAASGMHSNVNIHGGCHEGVGESTALPLQGGAGPRGRTLRRWLQGATSRLRVLRGADTSCPPMHAPVATGEATGDCGPLRRNLQKIDGGLPEQTWEGGFRHMHAGGDNMETSYISTGVPVQESYSRHRDNSSLIEARSLRASQSVPRRMRLGAE